MLFILFSYFHISYLPWFRSSEQIKAPQLSQQIKQLFIQLLMTTVWLITASNHIALHQTALDHSWQNLTKLETCAPAMHRLYTSSKPLTGAT